MRTRLKEVNGIDWGDAAVMNCKWKGVWLKDILERAEVTLDSGHVAFSCYQSRVQGVDWYGGSIELWRAMNGDADVLLALEVTSLLVPPLNTSKSIQMNGKPLSYNHGYPVRVIVPGVSGCRSVKWLDQITVQPDESTNLYQRNDYKVLPPEATDAEAARRYWDVTPALQDMPVNSVVASPEPGETVILSPDGTVEVKGYALPQGSDGPVVRVEISTDDGRTWQEAEILAESEDQSKWCWSLWKAKVRVGKGQNRRLLSRATDNGGNMQNAWPEWNLRGVAYDGYGESGGLTVQ